MSKPNIHFENKNSSEVLRYIALGLVLFFIDQLTKYLVYSKGQGNFLSKLMPVFGKQIFPNYNFAFSLPVPIVLIYAIYVVLLVALIFWFVKSKNKTSMVKIGLVFILAGAASNIFDRIFLGYVRDFIYVFWGNIFNLADLFILAGIILLLV